MRISILAISTDFGRYQKEEALQRKTWAANPPSEVSCYWVKSSPLIHKVGLSEDSTIEIPGHENYQNILKKRIESIRWLYLREKFDFYVLTNSSSFIDLKNLTLLLGRLGKGIDFGGYVNFSPSKSHEPILNDFVNGGFMILSQRATKTLCAINEEEYSGIADDVAISAFLRKKGYQSLPLAISNISEGKPYDPDFAYYRIRHISKPRITQKRMIEIDRMKREGIKDQRTFMVKEAWRMARETQEYQKSFRRFISYLRSYPRS